MAQNKRNQVKVEKNRQIRQKISRTTEFIPISYIFSGHNIESIDIAVNR